MSVRTLRALVALASVALFAPACATCPPIDEDALAERVLARVSELLAGGELDAPDASSGDEAPSLASQLASLPYEAMPRRGPADAPVRIVVVSDFECPFCGRVVPTLDRLREEYGDRVVFYFLNYPLPFHRRARAAATAAIEAGVQGGDDAFYRMHDRLFANQRALEDDDLVRYATELGLDGDAMRLALGSAPFEDRIDRDIALANQLGVEGTPTTFVGETVIVGADSFATFRAAVQAELER